LIVLKKITDKVKDIFSKFPTTVNQAQQSCLYQGYAEALDVTLKWQGLGDLSTEN
jgi:hypothetical protein